MTAATDDGLRDRLFAHWRAVAERMADLPIANPALSVHVTEDRRWRGARILVVTTPWFMNAVAVPDDASGWPPPGSPVAVPLPDGELDALVAEVEGFGRFAVASLFSPMDEFASMDRALAVAEAALAELMAVPEPEPDGALATAMDRRALLFGRGREARS